MPDQSFSVEYAKSNRSTCKVCKGKIEKDFIRIGTEVAGLGDYNMMSWRHLECQKRPKPSKGLDSLDELAGLTALSAADQAKVEAWFLSRAPEAASKSSGKKRAAGEDGGAGAISGDPKKMKIGELKEACAAAGLAATGKKDALVKQLEPVIERRKVEEAYAALSGDKLKAMLELNAQKKSGTKDELIERCVDGKLYGALPRCLDCGGGILRVSYPSKYGHGGKGRYSCPGYYEDEGYIRCGFSATDVERAEWQEPDFGNLKKKAPAASVASTASPASTAPAAPAAARLPDDDE